MSDFEFLFGFYGLLLGLIVAEVAIKFADAVDSQRDRPVGYLTPLLAAFVLFDVTGFWLWGWSIREIITVSWPSVFAALITGFIYFLSAALVFPRNPQRWASLDDHYWARKRFVLGGILLVNVAITVGQFTRAIPGLSDFWFFFWQLSYFGPIIALWFSKRRLVDLAMLGWLMLYWAFAVSDVLPNSQWGDAVGLNGTPASTSAEPAPK